MGKETEFNPFKPDTKRQDPTRLGGFSKYPVPRVLRPSQRLVTSVVMTQTKTSQESSVKTNNNSQDSRNNT